MGTVKSKIINPKKWKKSIHVNDNSVFSADDVIDAYFKGKKSGIEKQTELGLNQLRKNILESGVNTQTMIDYLKSVGIKPKSAHLKFNSYSDFMILIMVSESDILSDKILNCYAKANEIEKSSKSNLYNLLFTFTDFSEENFDKELLISDGYFMNYSGLIKS